MVMVAAIGERQIEGQQRVGTSLVRAQEPDASNIYHRNWVDKLRLLLLTSITIFDP